MFISTETIFFSFKARPDPGVVGLGFPGVEKVLPASMTLREEWTLSPRSPG